MFRDRSPLSWLKHSTVIMDVYIYIGLQLNCNWLPGNPQLPPYIYIFIGYLSYPILSGESQGTVP